MYVRPTTSYTSEMSAAFQYEEKEVQPVPKKSNCELRPTLWPVFLQFQKTCKSRISVFYATGSLKSKVVQVDLSG